MRKFISLAVFAGLTMMTLSIQAQEKDRQKTNQVPKEIMAALRAKFPSPEIDKWTKEKEGGIFMYDIEFKQGGQKFEADIKEDGTIDNWEKAIAIKDLPEAARRTVDKRYPKASIQEIMQTITIKSGRDVPEGYEVVLITSDKKDAEITVASDGKILEDTTGKK